MLKLNICCRRPRKVTFDSVEASANMLSLPYYGWQTITFAEDVIPFREWYVRRNAQDLARSATKANVF